MNVPEHSGAGGPGNRALRAALKIQRARTAVVRRNLVAAGPRRGVGFPVMTPKERLVAALERRKTDRLPVTTHHVMPSFLSHQMPGATNDDFFAAYGLDPIYWIQAHTTAPGRGEWVEAGQLTVAIEAPRLVSDRWRITVEELPHPEFRTLRYTIHTPRKDLTLVLQNNEHTAWVTERLLKEKADIELIAEFAPQPVSDIAAVNRAADHHGNRSMIRGFVNGFDLYGQPGCWQDACVLFGVEELILETFDDPSWVHHLLRILQARKARFIDSLKGARYDVIELGGGDASSTVISPKLFDEFVAPYDKVLVEHAHAAGQRVVYHTCGGMMPILERVADMGVDAMETFTPPGMGGDTRLAEAKRRIGGRVCMIGGFDQSKFFLRSTEAETRAEVRRCFAEAGAGGGFILSPSDHFFAARPELLHAFADEARRCTYD